MGNEFRYTFMVNTRRLLLVVCATFALVLCVQYSKLSYGMFLSFLFPTGRFQGEPKDKFVVWDSFTYLNSSRDLVNSSSLNGTDQNVIDEVSNEKNSQVIEFKDDGENVKNFGDASGGDDDFDPEDELPSEGFLRVNNSSVQSSDEDNSLKVKNPREFELSVPNYTSRGDSSLDHNISIPQVTFPLSNLQTNFTSPGMVDTKASNIMESPSASTSSTGEVAEDTVLNSGNPNIMKSGESNPINDSAINSTSTRKKTFKEAAAPVLVPISEMNHMLHQSHVSYRSVKPRWSSSVDRELLNVRSLIENAPIIAKDSHMDIRLYRNFSAFRRSYELMEKVLKVYVYAEGERPVYHQPPLKGIYASEGWFMKQLKSDKRFVTKNTETAHLFYLPFSSRELATALYIPNLHSRDYMVLNLRNYIDLIKQKYDSWNRTRGGDHFLVACHDWGPAETKVVMANCMRALCNSDINEGFQFGKDAALPETYVRTAQNPLRQLGGKSPSQRRILAFFAGSMHGYLRPILLNFWENKDPDMKIFGRLQRAKGATSYVQYMKSSKYCICAKGYEVNSPRVVEAIFYECVPVIISDNFVPPFFETLNWESFAVFVLEKDVPNLKHILLSIPNKRYRRMQQRVKQVQQHFLWHSTPQKFDIFHMILHSIWHNRVFRT